MSDSESETIYSESERSEDEDSEGSLVDFVVNDSDDEELEACPSCHTEICVSNIINRKRRHAEVVQEESSDDEDDDEGGDEGGDEGDEGSEDSDSSSDYAASEASDSCSEGSSSECE